jgi:hypothetical protein
MSIVQWVRNLSYCFQLGRRHYRQAALTISRVNRFLNTRFTAILLNPFWFIPFVIFPRSSPVVPSSFSVFVFYSSVFFCLIYLLLTPIRRVVVSY